MLRKTTVVLACLSVMGTAMAANSGFYVGANLGRDSGQMKINDDAVEHTKESNHLHDYLWGLQAGYDWSLSHNAVIGAEAFFSHSSAQALVSNTNADGRREFEKTNSYGLSVLPGWQIDDHNRLYARLGWVKSRFEHESDSTLFFAPPFKVTRDGIQWGLGYQTNITSNLTLNFDYRQTHYSTIHRASGTNLYAYQPTFNQYTVGVNYYFKNLATHVAKDRFSIHNNTWYAGGAAGVIDARLEENINGANFMRTVPYALAGELINVHGGYRWALPKRFTVGTELFHQHNTADLDYQRFTAINSDFTLHENNSYGVSVLPGYQLNDCNMPYLRLGIIYSNFTKTGAGTNGPLFNQTVHGTQLGVGDQLVLWGNWSVYLEYDHSQYQTIHTRDSNTNLNYDYKPHDNQYTLGVNYAFS